MKQECLKGPLEEKLCCEKKLPIIKSNGSLHLLSTNDIMYVRASRNYSILVDVKMHEYISSKSLKFYQDKLCEYRFIRCHRSFLVNTAFLTDINKKKNEITLNHDLILPCGTDIINQLIARLSI